jgi:hypothetical protein
VTRWILATLLVLGALHADARAQVFKPRTKNGPAKAIVVAAPKGEKAEPGTAKAAAATPATATKRAATATKRPVKRPAKRRPAPSTDDDDDVVVVDDDDDE